MNKGRTRIYLLRHGETANTADGRFRYNGQTDIDVTERGVAQLNAQAERLKDRPIRRVYSSGLIRSVMGAKAIAGVVSAHVHRDARLKEIHAGRWEAHLLVNQLRRGEFEFGR